MLAGGDLVAELFERLDARADEDDARLVAGPREVRVLRQEAVARMDRVDPVLLGDGDDAVECRGTTRIGSPGLPTR